MCSPDEPPVKALNFLQTEVSSVVDHSDPQETEIFRSLLANLIGIDPSRAGRPASPDEVWTNEIREQTITAEKLRESVDPLELASNSENSGTKLSGARFKQRMDLFESLMEYISEEAKQPSGNLVDLFNGDLMQNL
jgi:muskelin